MNLLIDVRGTVVLYYRPNTCMSCRATTRIRDGPAVLFIGVPTFPMSPERNVLKNSEKFVLGSFETVDGG